MTPEPKGAGMTPEHTAERIAQQYLDPKYGHGDVKAAIAQAIREAIAETEAALAEARRNEKATWDAARLMQESAHKGDGVLQRRIATLEAALAEAKRERDSARDELAAKYSTVRDEALTMGEQLAASQAREEELAGIIRMNDAAAKDLMGLRKKAEAREAALFAALQRIHEGACRTAQDSRSRDDDRYCIADVIETSGKALAGSQSALDAVTAEKDRRIAELEAVLGEIAKGTNTAGLHWSAKYLSEKAAEALAGSQSALDTVTAENRRLREALEPFREYAEYTLGHLLTQHHIKLTDELLLTHNLKIRHLKALIAALAPQEPKP